MRIGLRPVEVSSVDQSVHKSMYCKCRLSCSVSLTLSKYLIASVVVLDIDNLGGFFSSAFCFDFEIECCRDETLEFEVYELH